MLKNGLPELLIPVGSPEVLPAALRYGADAVYLGGEKLGLRARARNFTVPQIREAVRASHDAGVRVYVTANIFAHDKDLDEAEAYLLRLKEAAPDALIVSDPGLFRLIRNLLPDMPVHISTQANNVNAGTFRFWHDLGASRVVAGRELSLEELSRIRREVPEDLEIEAFVHGAMCISYSGRCLLSSYMTGRDGNRGACTHPCRWTYALTEEKRPGEYFPVEEDEKGTFIMSSKDLCMIEHLPELLGAGVDSLKIEGRMKNALYVASVTRAYRLALDLLKEGEEAYRMRLPRLLEELRLCEVRPFTTGFFFGRPGADALDAGEEAPVRAVYIGTAGEYAPDGRIKMIQKNKFSVGEDVEILKPDGRDLPSRVLSIRGEDGLEEESAPHAAEHLSVLFDPAPEPGDVIRKRSNGTV